MRRLSLTYSSAASSSMPAAKAGAENSRPGAKAATAARRIMRGSLRTGGRRKSREVAEHPVDAGRVERLEYRPHVAVQTRSVGTDGQATLQPLGQEVVLRPHRPGMHQQARCVGVRDQRGGREQFVAVVG